MFKSVVQKNIWRIDAYLGNEHTLIRNKPEVFKRAKYLLSSLIISTLIVFSNFKILPIFKYNNDVNSPFLQNFWVHFILSCDSLVIFDWQKNHQINLHYRLINHFEHNTKLAGIKKQMRWVLKTIFKWPLLKALYRLNSSFPVFSSHSPELVQVYTCTSLPSQHP